jgi:hypothetical protein
MSKGKCKRKSSPARFSMQGGMPTILDDPKMRDPGTMIFHGKSRVQSNKRRESLLKGTDVGTLLPITSHEIMVPRTDSSETIMQRKAPG